MKYKHAHDLFNMKQGNMNVEEFCEKMQRLARELDADEYMLAYAVINRLNAEIRNHVTRSQPTTWTDLVHHAKIGEMCVPVLAQTDTTLFVKLEMIQDQLKQLSNEKTQPQRAISPIRANPSRQRAGSPSPRRVCFDDGWDRRPRFEEYRNPYDTGHEDRRPLSQYNRSRSDGRGGIRGYRSNGDGIPRHQWQDDGYRGSVFRGRDEFSGRGRSTRRDGAAARQCLDFNPDICGKCGQRRRQDLNMCPAINQECRRCGRKGHYFRMCWATARMQTRSE